MTPHINAKKGEIAKTVLMPGDPLRAKFIAETYLKDVKLVNEVRNMFMYTGTYKGKKISVCGSGMGQPSIGIYAYELYKFFDVENIVRIGSAGAYVKELKIYDVVVATEAYSDSNNFSKLMLGEDSHVTYPSKPLTNRIIAIAAEHDIPLHKERIHSSDVFYSDRSLEETLKDTGNAACVEMESAALFAVAKKLKRNAACLLTISDSFITHEVTTADERQNAFTKMMEIALELA